MESDQSPLNHQLVMENIIEAIRDGVMVIDSEGSITMLNPACCEILGYRPEDLLGRSWGELFVSGEDNLGFSQSVVEVIQTRQVHHNSQVGYLTPQGHRKELIVTSSLIRDQDDRMLGVVTVIKDVTEIYGLHRRERELLTHSRRLYEEKKEGLDRIARAVAHEVRNPVAAIGGLTARLLRGEEPGSRKASYLRRILDSSARLELIVKEVKVYAEMPAPKPSPIRLDLWLAELARGYEEEAARRGVKLETDLEDRVRLEADTSQLGSAMASLIDNALEAMPEGGLLRLGLESGEDEARIMVSDTGKGISPNDMPFLFDPFFTTKASAVGMSLAITKRVVNEHNGRLEVASRPGHGTTFWLYLPLNPLP